MWIWTSFNGVYGGQTKFNDHSLSSKISWHYCIPSKDEQTKNFPKIAVVQLQKFAKSHKPMLHWIYTKYEPPIGHFYTQNVKDFWFLEIQIVYLYRSKYVQYSYYKLYNIQYLAKYAGRQKVIFIYCTWIIELKSKSVFHRNIRHVIHIVFLGHSVFWKIWKYLIHCVFFGKVENIWYTVFCRQVKHIWNTLYLWENS